MLARRSGRGVIRRSPFTSTDGPGSWTGPGRASGYSIRAGTGTVLATLGTGTELSRDQRDRPPLNAFGACTAQAKVGRQAGWKKGSNQTLGGVSIVADQSPGGKFVWAGASNERKGAGGRPGLEECDGPLCLCVCLLRAPWGRRPLLVCFFAQAQAQARVRCPREID